MKSLRLVAVVCLLFSSMAVVAEEKQSILTFSVFNDENGKPIRNASIVLHSVGKKGKQAKGGQQLKTDATGKTNYPGVPYGKLRIQVIAPGYQTFGQDVEITEPEREIVIKLKRPTEQYSIYK